MSVGGIKALTDFMAGGYIPDSTFREMIEALPVAIYATDSRGYLTYFNSATTKLVGREPELGKDQWCVVGKAFLPDGTPLQLQESPLAIALSGKDVLSGLEFIAERPDGSRFWFTPNPTVLRDAQGRITAGINLLVDITERKNAAIEAREQFRTIVDATPECVKIVDRDGTLLFMNAPGLDAVGATDAEAVIGKSVYGLIAPEHRDKFRAFNERICSGAKESLEFDIIGSSGEHHHMETHAAPLRHVDGTTVHLAVTHDISERKRLETTAPLLSAIVDSSDDAIISKDLNGIITSWNSSAERLFGYTAEETIGRSVTMLIPTDRLQEEPAILDRLKRGERVDHFETLRRRKDGKLIDISLTISPVKDRWGNVVGASKIARDITGRKLAEKALQESQTSFRQLADSMPQMVWTARPDGYFDYYNERWYQFTGFPRESFGDMSWEPILHPDDVKRCRDSWYGAVESGKPFQIEYRFRDRNENRWRWFMGRALPVLDPEGNVLKWFGSWTDIDEQKNVEDDLRRANQDLEQFAFSASHDLQEPLRSVKIYSELLARSCGDGIDGEAQQYLTYLRNGATRMEMLLRDLLSYTQVTKFDTPPQATDAGEALDASLTGLAGAIEEAGARVSHDPLPSVPVHGTHLQQLFQNLIGNAIKYRNPERPPIVHVSAERQNGSWVFSVTDNGIGIDPAYKENIFGLFKRLHRNDEYSGTGIGLAICRRIVERYHGGISVESQPGEGSSFRFTLPA